MALACLLGMTVACRSSAPLPPAPEVVTASFRPGWFGAVFRVGIASDGTVHLTTREWANGQPYEVQHPRPRLSKVELRRLDDLLADANLAALRERYEIPVSDQDEIAVSDPRTSRTVVIYGPDALCDDPFFAPLLTLWNEILELTKPPRAPRRRDYRLCGR
jgi:hypothetical protein